MTTSNVVALSAVGLDDILVGCALLGAGGGGSLVLGRETIARDLAAGLEFRLIGLDDLDPDAWTACPYVAGALAPDADVVPLADGVDPEALGAMRALEAHLGAPIAAAVATELGAENTADALSVAARLGIPLVDGDPSGRAVPELSQSTYHLAGLSITPLAVATRFGDSAVISRVASEQRAEELVRAMATASGDTIGVADHPVRAAHLGPALIPGTISHARRLGSVWRKARAVGADVAAMCAAAGGGQVVFRGVVSAYDWNISGGFTRGEVQLLDEYGARCRIAFQNEFVIAWIDGQVVATMPDILTLLDNCGEPVLNPEIEVGQAHCVIALPAPTPWTTPAGLALLGPRHFGYDVDWPGLHAAH